MESNRNDGCKKEHDPERLEDEMNIREGKKQRRREQKMRRRGQKNGSYKYKKWR